MVKKLLFLFVFVIFQVHGQLPQSGLVVKYEFTNGSISGLSKSGSAASFVNDRFTQPNNAIELNGDRLFRSNIGYSSNQATISFWVKTTTNVSTVKTIYDDAKDRNSAADNTNWAGHYILLQSGKIGYVVQQLYQSSNVGNGGRVGIKKLSPTVISDGNWHHVALSIKHTSTGTGVFIAGREVRNYRTDAKLYIDGVLSTSSSDTRGTELGFTGNWQTTGNITISNNRISNLPQGNRYTDIIDDVVIYNRELPLSDINALYTALPTCESPSGVQVNFVDASTADVSWNAVSNYADSYDVIFVEAGQQISNGTVIQNISGTTTQITNLIAGTSYDVYVRTNCTGAGTAQSETSKVTYAAPNCEKPQNIVGVTTGSNTAEITWDAVANYADSYELVYAVAGQPLSSGITIQNITGTTVNLTGLVDQELYDIYVRTNCDNRFTNPSDFEKITYLQSTRVYVSENATGNNTGASWTDAYTSLKDALDDGVRGKKEIWITRGTYKPSSTNNRNDRFNINIEGLKIYGGFAGNETSLNQRDYFNNRTILSGDLLGNDDANVTFNNTTRSDNSLRIINVTGNNVLIDGVIISGGYADATSGDGRFGAGLSLNPNISDFSIKNTTVKNNVAYWAAGLNLSASISGTVNYSVDACVFDNNLSSNAATAMYVIPASGTGMMNFKLSNSLFKNNRTEDDGTRKAKGGIVWLRSYYSGTVIATDIVNNTFVNNLNEGTDANSDFPTLIIGQQSGTFGTINLANNIFWGNKTNNGNVALALGKASDNNLASNISVFNSIDEDNFSNISTKTNVSNSDPLFTDVVNGDFTLQASSPAVDAGDNTKIPSGITTDLFANQRIFNSTVDMGAYESGQAAPTIKYVLDINALNGTVTVSPNASNGLYVDGTSVELTATPASGYQFDGWSGDATGTTNPLMITMDADKTVTAMFSKIQRTLTLNATNGSVSTNPNPTGGTYDDGTSVVLTATPASGYQFDGWSGDASGTTNPLTITMDADKTVTAIFSKIQRTLTLNATNGSVSTNPNPVGGTYDDGTSVQLTATPASGYQFDGWSGDVTGTSNPVSITMDADKTVTAAFSPIQRTLTVNVTGNGSVTPVSGTTFNDGDTATLTATPDAGWEFVGWSNDASGSTNPLTITMDADKVVTATFARIQRTLTINITGNGTVTPPNGSIYNDGTVATVTATPASGYQFDGWSGDATGTTNPLTITMDADKTVTAIFSPIQRTLTINATNGSVSTNPNPTGGTYDNGASVQLTATPDAGYQFDGWSGDAAGTTNPLTITMDADKTVTAIFSKIQRTLTINATNGTVNVSNPFALKEVGVNGGKVNTQTGQFDDGTTIRLTAVPDSGYQFDGWSGDATGTANPTDIVMDSDKTVTAMFSAVTASVVDEEFNKGVKVYPIPASSVLTVDVLNNYEIKRIVIYSVLGKKIIETKESKIDVSNLVNGIYILKVTDSEGRVASRRIIKK
ncbi:putative repeat protein (TIGR02543 family)/predicted secreted protein (Por secretion system target) [Tenacibaculum sp. 190524A05c]|uniref:InlB B-repeat-containing protein n=1 Tax=Tenacibaculum platacis TaxID=3137852 RepID=UPI0031FAD1FC